MQTSPCKWWSLHRSTNIKKWIWRQQWRGLQKTCYGSPFYQHHGQMPELAWLYGYEIQHGPLPCMDESGITCNDITVIKRNTWRSMSNEVKPKIEKKEKKMRQKTEIVTFKVAWGRLLATFSLSVGSFPQRWWFWRRWSIWSRRWSKHTCTAFGYLRTPMSITPSLCLSSTLSFHCHFTSLFPFSFPSPMNHK